MELLKSQIKHQNRNKLFYGKYEYKAEVNSLAIRFIFRSKNANHCVTRITTYNDRRLSSPWLRENDTKIDVSNLNLDLIEKVIAFYRKHKNDDVTFLRSGYSHNVFSFYTNDISMLEEIADICPEVEFTRAIPPPDKVMYFSKEPPYQYRVYLKSKRVESELISTLTNFLQNNQATTHRSGGLGFFLIRHNLRGQGQYTNNLPPYGYLPNNCFIDFQEEQTLTLMHLLFSDCLRKSYKLEKRP